MDSGKWRRRPDTSPSESRESPEYLHFLFLNSGQFSPPRWYRLTFEVARGVTVFPGPSLASGVSLGPSETACISNALPAAFLNCTNFPCGASIPIAFLVAGYSTMLIPSQGTSSMSLLVKGQFRSPRAGPQKDL